MPPLGHTTAAAAATASSVARHHLRLQDVEGVGPAGKLAKVNHGYARNFLVPNQLALVVPRPRRGHRAAAAAEARSSSGAGAVARQQQAASSSGPLQLSLEKQQQQFDKLIKTLTGAPLVGEGQAVQAVQAGRRRPGLSGRAGDSLLLCAALQTGVGQECGAAMAHGAPSCRCCLHSTLCLSAADPQAPHQGWAGTRAGAAGTGHSGWVRLYTVRAGPCVVPAGADRLLRCLASD